jgi:hypothetical protein
VRYPRRTARTDAEAIGISSRIDRAHFDVNTSTCVSEAASTAGCSTAT